MICEICHKDKTEKRLGNLAAKVKRSICLSCCDEIANEVSRRAIARAEGGSTSLVPPDLITEVLQERDNAQ